MPNVTVIPATRFIHATSTIDGAARRRVAAYARVSTGSDEQFTSYEAQVDYYTRYIQARSDWEFVGVYADEGITGLSTKNREGFNRMVADALEGKINLIVTKSVSRFARNTVDSLVTIRKLKDAGCECFFEKENIYTFDGKGELLLTIMSSLAQEESRSISENVTWGQRKRFADGKINLPYAHFLGYRKGPDGLPEIVPEEAEVVKEIYGMFMRGMTAYTIAAKLTEKGIPTPSGKKIWRDCTINSILTNEKYKGEALLQKGFTVDFLTHKRKRNEGEVQQYYVENSHPAIIAPEEWALVQIEIQRRKGIGSKYSGYSVLASRIVCGDCGGFYSPKIWHSTEKWRKVMYRCQDKYKGEHRCQTPAVTEATIKEKFVVAINEMATDKSTILDDCRVLLETLTDCSAIDKEAAEVHKEAEIVAELAQRCISENAQTVRDQNTYQQEYEGYADRYEQLKAKEDKLENLRKARHGKAHLLRSFMAAFREMDGVLSGFDEKLWLTSIDKAIVQRDGQIVFVFYNGMEIAV